MILNIESSERFVSTGRELNEEKPLKTLTKRGFLTILERQQERQEVPVPFFKKQEGPTLQGGD